MTIHPTLGVCLDAGCGSGPKRPAPGFTAYCDIIRPREGVILPEPYHVAPLEDMSCFEDKFFDYVRCHHAIEHCEDPDKACSELVRVGKGGTISFPPAQAELMFGRADHRWFVFVDRGRLLFVKKRHESYGVPRKVTRCELNVDFKWKGSFEWQVVEAPEKHPLDRMTLRDVCVYLRATREPGVLPIQWNELSEETRDLFSRTAFGCELDEMVVGYSIPEAERWDYCSDERCAACGALERE